MKISFLFLSFLTTLLVGVQSEIFCPREVYTLASEASEKIQDILGKHVDAAYIRILKFPEKNLKSSLQLKSIIQASLIKAKTVFEGIDSEGYKTILDLQKKANNLNFLEDAFSSNVKNFGQLLENPKADIVQIFNEARISNGRVTFNPQIEDVTEFKSDVPVSEMFGKSLKDSVGNVAKSTAKKVSSNVAEISPANVIGDIAEKCTRSGCKDVTNAAKKTAKEVSKKSGSQFFKKLGTVITIGLAAYEGYGDYRENGDVGRAVVRTTASLGKNSLISAAMVPASALCGPFAPACFIGGTVGISSYTPDAKWVTDKLYE